jgi:hypothetical protein
MLGITEDVTDFDTELIVFINAAMGTLKFLGVGSALIFSISDATATWGQFLGESKLYELAKTYIYMKVKLAFDPPPMSYVLAAFQQIVAEAEFRLTVQADNAVIDARPIPIIEEGE